MIIVIDPSKAEGERFALRSRELVEQMQAAGLARMPGERRYREREVAAREGVALTERELTELEALAG